MRWLLFAAMLAATGCSSPESSRLVAGDIYAAYTDRADAEGIVAIYCPELDRRGHYLATLRPDFDPHKVPQLRVGDLLEIVEDAGDRGDSARRVRVKVLNGQLEGEGGDMARKDIRPRR